MDGAVILAFLEVGEAAIEEGLSVFRIELDRLVVVLDGAVIFVFVVVGEAAIVEFNGEKFSRETSRLNRRRAAANGLIVR